MPEDTYVPPEALPEFFIHELVAQRKARGWSGRRLAAEAHVAPSTVANVEAGIRLPNEDFGRAMDKPLDTHGLFERLAILVQRHATTGWVAEWLAIERAALRMSVFQPQVIPGLLQTPDYARAMLTGTRGRNVAAGIAGRLIRQEILVDDIDAHPYCGWIVDEQALRRPVGGPQVMRAQLEHILRMTDHPRRIFQVIGAETAAHAGLSGASSIFDVPEEVAPELDPTTEEDAVESTALPPLLMSSGPRLRRVVYIDGSLEGRITHDTRHVLAAERNYDLLLSVALSPDESAQRISDILKGM